jgi:LysM repeat protein
MIDKKILKHGVHGFGLKDEKTLEFNYDGNNNVKDYFGAYGDIIRDGKHAVYLKDENKRGRTGIGITDDSIVLVSIGDKENKYKCSSAVFMDTYFKGCDFAINLDGGGSSQWITPSNRYISGRLVAWYLCIWVDTISTAKVNGPEKVTKVPAPAPKGTPVSYITHTVAHGETLGSIARKYGTSYQKIAKDNNIKNVNLIHEGQKLKIYRGVK